MKVIRLTPIFGQRVIVKFDTETSLTIPLDTAVQFSLKPNLELTQEQYDSIKQTAFSQSMWNQVLKWATLRPRSMAEFHRYTQDKLSPELTDSFASRLKELNFLSDKDFSNWWVESRQTHRPRSKLELTHELKQKGISNSDLKSALSESDEPQACLDVAQKYFKKLSRFSKPEQKQKLYGYLMRRGFSTDSIKSAIKQLLDNPDY